METELSVADFEGKFLKEKRTLLVVFTANWCPFCLMFKPIFKSTMKDDNISYAVVDLTDFGNPLWERFKIEVVPTVLVFKDGEVIRRLDGRLGRGISKVALQDLVRDFSADLG